MTSIETHIKRGEVYLAKFSLPHNESEDERLVVVLQNNISNELSKTTTVAIILPEFPAILALPTIVPIVLDGYSKCVVTLDYILTIRKSQLIQKIGGLTLGELKRVEHATHVALGSVEFKTSEAEQLNKFYRFKIGTTVPMSEDSTYEFKEIRGKNPAGSISGNIATYTAAFLNSSGGTILYGIDNDRIVKGVHADAKVKDRIKQNIHSSISSINPKISPDHYILKFNQVYDQSGEHEIPDLYIVEVMVPPSLRNNEIYFVKDTELYVKLDGTKQKLANTQIVDYIRKKLIENGVN